MKTIITVSGEVIFLNNFKEMYILSLIVAPITYDFPSIPSSPGQETLLHLSARLGFSQLATYLLDQPGSMEALHIQDKSGKLPEEIAREKGMKLLADMFSRLT